MMGMQMNKDHGTFFPTALRSPRLHPRRGNAIVLVVGILVLLVIIATAYITRTHAGRVTASATRRTQIRDGNAQVIAESIAGEIASALFVSPVDRRDPALSTGVADSSFRRLSPLRVPFRHGVDVGINQDFLGPNDPDQPYNFAPYQVVPFTNWP